MNIINNINNQTALNKINIFLENKKSLSYLDHLLI